MLTAKRDPFHHDTRQSAPLSDPFGPAQPHGLTRTMTMLQVVGSLLAIPVAAGSAYSLYRANFSAETVCNGLRLNIVSMLDRSVDVSTQRMLVRRDVESFEKSCASVDPDATAAFKALLAAKPAPVQKASVQPEIKAEPKVVVKSAPKAEAKTEAKAEPVKVEAKAEPKSEPKSKTEVKLGAPATVFPAPLREAARTPEQQASDAAWIAAVRDALVKKDETPQPAVARITPQTPEPGPLTLAPPQPSQAPVQAAPALPPPASIAPSAQPVQQASDHPVPPGAIPDTPPPEKKRSTIGAIVARVPLVGAAVDAISGD